MKSVADVDVKGKKVLVRGDLDVPFDEGQRLVRDDFRLQALLPTLQHLVEQRAKIILCGHLGRPEGQVVEALRLDPVAEVLSQDLPAVYKVDAVVGETVRDEVNELVDGDILLLENLRFHPGEEANDPEFARELASLADLYVNEAFAVAHRAAASTVGVTQCLPAYAGFRLQEELKTLTEVRDQPERPLVFIMGGAKPETKVPLVRRLAQFADQILLGGELMFDESLKDLANVVFPVDAVDRYDVGPKTVAQFQEIIRGAQTVVWNGPLGKFEESAYAAGTRGVAEALIAATAAGVRVVVGGGETLAALKEFGGRDKIGYVSVGGGAMLAFLGKDRLPGIEALDQD